MFEDAIREIGERPGESDPRADKRRYGELVSNAIARHVAADLRTRGLTDCLPGEGGGAERTFAGGIGSKRVDVSWATPEAGLLFGSSIKTINFADTRTANYQKNLTNRRGDMLFESVTLHRRFPFAVMCGIFLLHEGAFHDGTDHRESTFLNAHDRFRIFTGRADPGDREESFERIYIGLYQGREPYSVRLYQAGAPEQEIHWDDVCRTLLQIIADRNPDHFRHLDGKLERRR